MSKVQQVTGWVQQQFGDKQSMSKDELQSKAQGSSLPEEGKQAIGQLPQGQYTKDDLTSKLKDTMMSKMGAGVGGGGGMGGMMGG